VVLYSCIPEASERLENWDGFPALPLPSLFLPLPLSSSFPLLNLFPFLPVSQSLTLEPLQLGSLGAVG